MSGINSNATPEEIENDLDFAIKTLAAMIERGIPCEPAFPVIIDAIKKRFEAEEGYTAESALDFVMRMNMHALQRLARIEIQKRN